MKKMLLAFTFVAAFSLVANAEETRITGKYQMYNFYFQAVNGDPYCDGMLLYVYGNPQTLVDGTHFNEFCNRGTTTGFDYGVNGFKAPVAANYQYGGSGPVLIVSDPWAYSAVVQGGTYWGIVYLINTQSKTWTIWASGDGYGEYVVNYGTFTLQNTPQAKGGVKGAKPSYAR